MNRYDFTFIYGIGIRIWDHRNEKLIKIHFTVLQLFSLFINLGLQAEYMFRGLWVTKNFVGSGFWSYLSSFSYFYEFGRFLNLFLLAFWFTFVNLSWKILFVECWPLPHAKLIHGVIHHFYITSNLRNVSYFL